MKKRKDKVHKVMSEFKAGQLHSGSKSGPKVKSRKQAIAIAMSEAGKSRNKRGMSVAAYEKKNRNKRLDTYG